MPGVRQTVDGVVEAGNGIAQTTTTGIGEVIDSFADSDISEYSGETSYFSVVDEANVTPDAIDGSTLLESSATGRRIYSTSGLANYYAKGDGTLVLYYYVDGGPDNVEFRPQYGLADGDNHYEIRVSDGGPFDILLFENGSFSSTVADTSNYPSLSADTWYRIELTWDDGTLGGSDNDHTVTLFEDATDTQLGGTPSGNDGTLASADGIGWRHRNADNETVYADYAHYST
jgi:hypothetical protein